MIITCDACLKRYLIDPLSLGASGREVRCSSCGHVWHQNPPEDMPKSLEIPSSQNPLALENQDNTRVAALSSQEFEPTTYEPLNSPSSPPSASSAQIRKGSGKYIGFGVGFFIISFLSCLYFGRFYIAVQWPWVVPFYDKVGLNTNPLDRHLKLQDVTWSVNSDDQQNPLFILKGKIINTSHKALQIPPLTVAFASTPSQDKDCKKRECLIDRWIAHTSSDRILPGEVYPFQISINKAIPPTATNLYIEFVRP